VKKSLLQEVQDLVSHIDLVEEGQRVKRVKITGNLNNVRRLIMEKLTPLIEMRVKVIYSFTADIYRGAAM